MKPSAPIRLTRRMHASPRQVFDAWLDPRLATRWLFATASRPLAQADIDARVDGAFRFVERRRGETTEYRGEYASIVPHRRLVFTLRDAQVARTRVTVDLAPIRGGCELTLVHENVPADRATHVHDRWAGMLYGLDALLESACQTLPDEQEHA